MKNYEELIKKIDELKKKGKIDLSMEEDLSIAVMNLISIEEHLFYTAEKTEKDKYYELLNQVRKNRTELMKKLVNKTEGETWCISKHLLATTMRLVEVGTKTYSSGDKDEAKDFFKKAFETYSMFWTIRFDSLVGDSTSSDNSVVSEEFSDKKELVEEKKKFNLKDVVKKLIDCCKE